MSNGVNVTLFNSSRKFLRSERIDGSCWSGNVSGNVRHRYAYSFGAETFGYWMLEVWAMDDIERGNSKFIMIRQEFVWMIVKCLLELSSPPRERRKPLKECPEE